MTLDAHITTGTFAQAIGARLTGDANLPVRDVSHDSREVAEGWLFAAIAGEKTDAHKYVEAVMRQGACGIVSERARPADFAGAWLQVEDARIALARAAAHVHHHPSRDLNLVGITGTNGKTTCAFLIAAIMEAAYEKVALLGTIEQRIGQRRSRAERTTPEASDTQRFLRQAATTGCHFAVMESSSQALDLHRCDSLEYGVAAWTNLSPDHLDYHKTMEDYYLSKRKLFDGSTGTRPRLAVINADDEYGRRLIDELTHTSHETPVVTYGLNEKLSPRPDTTATNIRISLRGMEFQLDSRAGTRCFTTPLVGRPHVSNILLATSVALAFDVPLDTIAHAVATCTGAPGRFEPIKHAGDFVVIVDYAHTDDALSNVLETARALVADTNGRVITVFGCGGDRDRTKRAPMGRTAACLSDVVILTSDNPRHEDPLVIMRDVEAGLNDESLKDESLKQGATPYVKIPDRRLAIARAIDEARPSDFVIIAGKGHEDYQIIGDQTFHFDDREVARETLAARGL
ncbi:MAG: UDP-N-acetylmuramoyl-L-alanyl-D-glutamate--2,6-diaminopimelate ligase [Pyrinomonadaceae bacterium MAG19_C2-C3]|nr:UDP-N-acetylmuramoyl-L-alanyl-D-glutamate--2,6-diaminopimelate ligase [Pyrinomonadaceae bacterium MAG19_C2-C3]